MQTQTESLNYHFGLDSDVVATKDVEVPSIKSVVKLPETYIPFKKPSVVAQSSAPISPNHFGQLTPSMPSIPAFPSIPAKSKKLEARPAKLSSQVDHSRSKNVVIPVGGLLKAAGALLIIGGIGAVCFGMFKSANATLPDAMKSVGDVAVAVGARPVAMQIYDANLKDPKYVTVLVEWGNTSRAHGRNEDALAYLNKAITVNPEYPLAYVNRGAVYLDMDQWQKAIADDTKAISLNSDYAMAYNNRACTYLNMGKPALAINDLNKAIEHEPGTMRYWLNRGNCYMQLKQYKQAIQNYDYAIAHGNVQAIELKQQAQTAMTPAHSNRLAHAKKHHAHKAIASK